MERKGILLTDDDHLLMSGVLASSCSAGRASTSTLSRRPMMMGTGIASREGALFSPRQRS